MSDELKEPFAFVIFGGSGDLSRRKLIPALYHLANLGCMPGRYAVVGTSRSPMTDDSFRDFVRQAVQEHLSEEQPDGSNEGISLSFAYKEPGTRFAVQDVKMDFSVGRTFEKRSPEAYERLLWTRCAATRHFLRDRTKWRRHGNLSLQSTTAGRNFPILCFRTMSPPARGLPKRDVFSTPPKRAASKERQAAGSALPHRHDNCDSLPAASPCRDKQTHGSACIAVAVRKLPISEQTGDPWTCKSADQSLMPTC